MVTGPPLLTAETLARLETVSPYFALASGPRPDASAYRPLADLHRLPEVLDAYVDEVGRSLGTGQRRVAASTLHLGVAARLWSVALGVLAFTGRVPDLAPERLHWRRAGSGPLPPWLPSSTAQPAAPATPGEDPAAALAASVLRSALDPLGAAMRARYGLSAHTLRGNAASALVGAVRMLHTRAADAPYPTLPAATALLTAAPATAEALPAGGPPAAGPFATAGTFTPDPITYRRRNCCLYYRLPGAGVCGDCVLTRV